MRGAVSLLVWLALSLTAQASGIGPGGIDLLAVDGKIVSVLAHGLADVENEVPIDERTVFRLSSLTKQFTAVAVLSFVEAGRLRLDDRLASVLPDCPTHWQSITIRQLLSHTSGITADMSAVFAHTKDDVSPHGLIAPFASRPLETMPGNAWRYSNVNYWILGLVLERLSGQPYAAVVEHRVLGTAGLSSIRIGSTADIVAHRARGYTKGPDGAWRNAPYFSSTIGYAAGGFVAAPADLARWYGALGAGELISHKTIAAAASEIHTSDGKDTGYGLGWYVERRCGLLFLHHGGSSPGFASYIYWQPDRRIFAGSFSNHDDLGEPKEAAWRLTQQRVRCRPR